MGRKSSLLFGLAVFLLALLVSAPAALLGGAVGVWSSNRLQLAGASGTVWAGQGVLTLDGEHLGRVRWTTVPAELLRGRLQAELAIDDGPSMTLAAAPGRLDIRPVALTLPAAALVHLLPSLQPARLGGRLTLTSPGLVWSADGLQGTASADWSQASSALARGVLGDYRLEMQGGSGDTRVRVTTRQGPLRLEGQGTSTAGEGMRIALNARAEGRREELEGMLRLLGIPQNDGSYLLQFPPGIR